MSEVVGHDRLTWDLDTSEHWPVVRGTWITTGEVVSLVKGGWTRPDILRAHPELVEADIRACLAWEQSELKVDTRHV